MKNLVFFLLTILATALTAQKSIIFYANISKASHEDWTGHVWAGFSDGRSSEKMYGFYPDGIRDDARRSRDVSYRFFISDEGFASALKTVQEFQNTRYIIGFKDCRMFAESVARAAGLKTPSVGIKSPAEWLAELVALN